MTRYADLVEYYAKIIDGANHLLEKNPFDDLHTEVTANISGGHFGWDCGASKVFQHPETWEEGLLALELRDVLQIAIKNQRRRVRNMANAKILKLGPLGIPMAFDLLLGSVIELANRDPFGALQAKIEMAEIAKCCDGNSLADFIAAHLLSEGAGSNDGDNLCAKF